MSEPAIATATPSTGSALPLRRRTVMSASGCHCGSLIPAELRVAAVIAHVVRSVPGAPSVTLRKRQAPRKARLSGSDRTGHGGLQGDVAEAEVGARTANA